MSAKKPAEPTDENLELLATALLDQMKVLLERDHTLEHAIVEIIHGDPIEVLFIPFPMNLFEIESFKELCLSTVGRKARRLRAHGVIVGSAAVFVEAVVAREDIEELRDIQGV